jgi:hypothetical protein
VSAGRRLLAVADALPVTVLAVIAGAGSFTHIRDTAAEHGQGGPMSWAVAVCVDLTCVMAARERQRDKQQGVVTRRLSWPAVVLAGGVLLSLAANLAQAQPTAWGRIVAAVPPVAFLVAVSMIERRAARRPRSVAGEDGAAGEPSWRGRPSPVPDSGDEARDGGDEALLTSARRAAAEHQDQHGQPITRDALRARLGVSNQAASELLRQLRAGEGLPPGPPAPPDPGCLPAPTGALVSGGQAGGGSTGTPKAWQPTGTGSPATDRPARGPGQRRDRLLPARRAAARVPPGRQRRSAELADRLSGFANL